MKDLLGRRIPKDFQIGFERHVLAECLWQYGEDTLADRAAQLSESDLIEVQRLAVWHHLNDPEEENPRVLGGRIMSRAAIDFFERRGRDTVRRRRRTRPKEQGYSA